MANPSNGHTKFSQIILAALQRAGRLSQDPQVVAELASLEIIDLLRDRKTAESKANDAHLLAGSPSSKNGEARDKRHQRRRDDEAE
jgi:hypothetical protein